MGKDVWSKNWDSFQKDPAAILKHTAIDGGFGESCYQYIKKHIQPNTKRVLEVGCGTGRFIIKLAQEFPHIEFEGSDLSPESIRLAQAGAELRGLKNALFQVDDMTKPQPKHATYDLVFNEGSVEHFRGDKDYFVLQQLTKLVAPKGTLLFGVPNFRCYAHTINKALAFGFYKYGFERSYKHEELLAYLAKLGLEDKKVSGVGFTHGMRRYGFPYTLLSRKYDQLLTTDPDKAERWEDRYGFFIFASGTKTCA